VTELRQLTVAMLSHHLEHHGIPGQEVMIGGYSWDPWGTVTAVAIAQPFGGVRWWLLCPRCHRRRRTLYQASRGLGCRTCLGLTYPSQRLSPSMLRYRRLGEEVARLWQRLGGRDDTPEGIWPRRPRGMHEATHARLKAEFERLTGEQFAIVNQQVVRLTRRMADRRG
jgi:hypothetical protein